MEKENRTNITTRLSWRLAELATASGLSLPFLRKEAAGGRLRIRKIGAAVIVLDEDARAFLSGGSSDKQDLTTESAAN